MKLRLMAAAFVAVFVAMAASVGLAQGANLAGVANVVANLNAGRCGTLTFNSQFGMNVALLGSPNPNPIPGTVDAKCDLIAHCMPLANCALATNPLPWSPDCAFIQTVSASMVGSQCAPKFGHRCYRCDRGNVIICMIYEYRMPGGTSDNCQWPCGLFELYTGGICVDPLSR